MLRSRRLARITEQYQPELRRVLSAAAGRVRAGVTMRAVVDAVEANALDVTGQSAGRAVAALVPVDLGEQYLATVLPALLGAMAVDAGRASVEDLAAVLVRKARRRAFEPNPDMGFSFDPTHRMTVDEIKRLAVEVAREWGTTTRAGIQTLVALMQPRVSPAKIARILRSEGIGLNARQAQALDRYRSRLEAEGRKPEQVARMSQRYANKLSKQRAETIARTVVARARNTSMRSALDQATRAGRLDGTERVQWVAYGGNPCDTCSDLDGQEITVAQYLAAGGIEGHNPPEHPNCECGIVMVS